MRASLLCYLVVFCLVEVRCLPCRTFSPDMLVEGGVWVFAVGPLLFLGFMKSYFSAGGWNE